MFLALILTAAGLASPGPANADVIVRWNQRAAIAAADAHLDPATETTMLAVMHAAMFDAVDGVRREAASTGRALNDASDVTAPAAAASAAHVVLSTYFPADRPALEAALMADLAALADTPARALGAAAGRQAADLAMARWPNTPRDVRAWSDVLALLAWDCESDDTQSWNRRARVRAEHYPADLWENARFFAVLNRALAAGRAD